MENAKNDQRGFEKAQKGECHRIQEMMAFQ